MLCVLSGTFRSLYNTTLALYNKTFCDVFIIKRDQLIMIFPAEIAPSRLLKVIFFIRTKTGSKFL